MIKTMIVDDDMLVRMGLKTVLPWNKYNMDIVGDAGNGEKALTILKEKDVDLMLIDLSMPGMSGIELMKIVKDEYPEIHMVVLTLHKEFNYIQQAMRLGAIDYITKDQFTKENFDDILERIQKRIESAKRESTDSYSLDDIYVVFSHSSKISFDFIQNKLLAAELNVEDIDDDILIVSLNKDNDEIKLKEIILETLDNRNFWYVLKINSVQGKKKKEVHKIIRKYRKNDLFYDFNKDKQLLFKNIKELDNVQSEYSNDEYNLAFDDIIALKWLGDREYLEKAMNKLKGFRLPTAKLFYLMHQVLIQWEKIYSNISDVKIKVPEKITRWNDVESWFCKVGDITDNLLVSEAYSKDTTMCIMKAVQIIQKEYNEQLHASDVAARVNLSKSYFNICFKNLIGKSFNLYLREVRIDKAKEYLTMTEKSILLVSEMVGYMDSKYFSRLFYEHTGLLPSKYRIKNRKR